MKKIRSLWTRLVDFVSPPYPRAEAVAAEIRTLTADSERRLQNILEQIERLPQ